MIKKGIVLISIGTYFLLNDVIGLVLSKEIIEAIALDLGSSENVFTIVIIFNFFLTILFLGLGIRRYINYRKKTKEELKDET